MVGKKKPTAGTVGGSEIGTSQASISARDYSTVRTSGGGEGRSVLATVPAGRPTGRAAGRRDFISLMQEHNDNAAAVRAAAEAGWPELVVNLAHWKLFLSLTWDPNRPGPEVTKERALLCWRSLVQRLNVDLFGTHYVRIVGHSYFAYALTVEHHKDGRLHMHALVDRPLHFSLVHQVWNHLSGYAWIEPVTDPWGNARYLCKYVTKEGDLKLWRPLHYKIPKFVPSWFSDDEYLTNSMPVETVAVKTQYAEAGPAKNEAESKGVKAGRPKQKLRAINDDGRLP